MKRLRIRQKMIRESAVHCWRIAMRAIVARIPSHARWDERDADLDQLGLCRSSDTQR